MLFPYTFKMATVDVEFEPYEIVDVAQPFSELYLSERSSLDNIFDNFELTEAVELIEMRYGIRFSEVDIYTAYNERHAQNEMYAALLDKDWNDYLLVMQGLVERTFSNKKEAKQAVSEETDTRDVILNSGVFADSGLSYTDFRASLQDLVKSRNKGHQKSGPAYELAIGLQTEVSSGSTLQLDATGISEDVAAIVNVYGPSAITELDIFDIKMITGLDFKDWDEPYRKDTFLDIVAGDFEDLQLAEAA